MKEFVFFILGVVSILFLLPVCNQLLELVSLWIEAFKIRPSRKILKYQAETTVLREFTKPAEPTPDYEIEYVYGDDDKEDFEE
jgi:hypothetical protein